MKSSIQKTMTIELSLKFLEQEKEELVKDLAVFTKAYDILRRRVIYSEDHGPKRVPVLRQWSGTCSVLGALEMSIHSIERSVEDYSVLIQKVVGGDIGNSDVKSIPNLKIIEGGSR